MDRKERWQLFLSGITILRPMYNARSWRWFIAMYTKAGGWSPYDSDLFHKQAFDTKDDAIEMIDILIGENLTKIRKDE